MKKSGLMNYTATYLFLIIITALCLVPFLMMFINATRASTDIRQGLSLMPGNELIKNWKNLQTSENNITRPFFNSTIVTLSATLLASYFSALTAYGLTMYRFRGSKTLFSVFVLGVIMVPLQLGLIGFYDLCLKMKILNTFIPLIIPAMASPFFVFFLRQYIKQVINESLIQAGRIDGASEIGIFHRLILPVIMPGVATTAIFSFVASWNNYLTPFVIITSDLKKTLPIVIGALNFGPYRTDLGLLYLAISVSILPILIVFTVLQKRVMTNVAIGGNKE